jgi:hypothetical protein
MLAEVVRWVNDHVLVSLIAASGFNLALCCVVLKAVKEALKESLDEASSLVRNVTVDKRLGAISEVMDRVMEDTCYMQEALERNRENTVGLTGRLKDLTERAEKAERDLTAALGVASGALSVPSSAPPSESVSSPSDTGGSFLSDALKTAAVAFVAGKVAEAMGGALEGPADVEAAAKVEPVPIARTQVEPVPIARPQVQPLVLTDEAELFIDGWEDSDDDDDDEGFFDDVEEV